MNDDKGTSVIERARGGDRAALEAVVRELQDPIHHLAMRILVNPDDALEATQEILVVVVTRLSTFEGRSSLRTWAYRIAVNYLINAKKLRNRDPGLSFEAFDADLHDGLVDDAAASSEDVVMLNELRLSCTMAMLLCLDLKHRLAYVLGDVLELEHGEAADILGISPANFRQRLARARAEVVAFTGRACGIANASARCSCPRRLPAAIALGRITPGARGFASLGGPSYEDVVAKARAVEGALVALTLQRSTPHFAAPADLAARLTAMIDNAP